VNGFGGSVQALSGCASRRCFDLMPEASRVDLELGIASRKVDVAIARFVIAPAFRPQHSSGVATLRALHEHELTNRSNSQTVRRFDDDRKDSSPAGDDRTTRQRSAPESFANHGSTRLDDAHAACEVDTNAAEVAARGKGEIHVVQTQWVARTAGFARRAVHVERRLHDAEPVIVGRERFRSKAGRIRAQRLTSTTVRGRRRPAARRRLRD
jgi:hypothetical protein